MRNFKGRLTKIRNLMQENLPEGPDAYGFLGITKSMLVKTCDDMQLLAEHMEKNGEAQEFEILALIRFEAKVHESLKKFLEEETGSGKVKDKFDSFLDNFSRLYERTKQAYFIVNNNGLRNDVEVLTLRNQIEELQIRKAEYESLVETLSQRSKVATTRTAEIETALVDAMKLIQEESALCKTSSTTVAKSLADTTKWGQEIETVHQKLSNWDADIQTRLDAAKANQSATEALLKSVKAGASDVEEATKKADALTVQTTATHEDNKRLISEITNTLGDANRVGMGASFKTQMLVMERTQNQWKWTFIVTLGVLLLVSGGIVLAHLLKDASTWQSTVVRLTTVTPLVWLAWFSVRQYGFANRVREDYAYKHSTAMAYEGYKKAARQASPELERALIEVALVNLALNPVRLYSPKDADHATPISEWYDKVFGRVTSAKVTVTPTGGSVQADMKLEK